VTPFRDWGIKFPLGEFPKTLKNEASIVIGKIARADFDKILRAAAVFKRERGHHKTQPLAGQTWALMFSKSSTRTRVSFEVGIRELGGRPMFLNAQ
jgi:ornithine carbamoyltransferase